MQPRPKIHVFLGAPPPSSLSAMQPEANAPPAGWRDLELTWRNGALHPVAAKLDGEADWTAGKKPSDCSNEENEDIVGLGVREYLDSCFPTAGVEPLPALPLSDPALYLSTWTMSQALVLRGRQGVQSAASPEKTPPNPSPQVEEGGVVLQAVGNGILCTQEPPVAEDCGRTLSRSTLLSSCQRAGQRVEVLVAVVHPSHLKEIKVKSGRWAGSSVPLASMVVTDQSGVEMKVVLWRRAAFWALTTSPGEILLITGLQVRDDEWRGETVLQSTFNTKLLNLGHASTCETDPQRVDADSLHSLCKYIRKRRPLVFSMPRRALQDLNRLPYATLRSLRVNTLVHALLRVTHTHKSSEWRSNAASHSKSALQLKVVLTVEQADGQQGELLLWGSAQEWLPRFHGDTGTVWNFRVLLVRGGVTSNLPELHSTPWSSAHPLDPADRRVLDFMTRKEGSGNTVELDVDTLLSQKYSGEVELQIQILSFGFLNATVTLDSSTPLAEITTTLGGDVTYTGCGRCGLELDADANGIYRPCYPCLPRTAVRRYYRPGVLNVSGRGLHHLSVQVPPEPLQKILQAPPDRLQQSCAAGSELKFIQVAAQRLLDLLRLPRKLVTITLRSHFLCDENSIPISQEFTLLDLRYDEAGLPGVASPTTMC